MNKKINWRNGVKVIIHLADAGAHGKEFTLSDKYPEESEKLKTELLKCCQKGIKIFGYVITDDARNSFNQCQKYFRSNGGSFEICEFKIAEGYSDYKYREIKKKKKCKKEDSYDDEDEYIERKFKKKEKCKKADSSEEEDYGSDEDKSDEEVEYKIFSKQKIINSEFRTRVLHSVKNALP